MLDNNISRRTATTWLAPVIVVAVAAPQAVASAPNGRIQLAFTPAFVSTEAYNRDHSEQVDLSITNIGAEIFPEYITILLPHEEGNAAPVVYPERGDGFDWIPSYVGEDFRWVTTRPIAPKESIVIPGTRFKLSSPATEFTVSAIASTRSEISALASLHIRRGT